ncbi:hypothetical protein MKW98_023742 [Papaver atlanticum]|uniref:Uncharacterized protein n=1 Tax=Papaver atlanticum TaxID=357466 RepID=A0AAD4SZT3_9MAGN|nr:hypothetical protein MKW98_023742 [Papaver atlanticum]
MVVAKITKYVISYKAFVNCAARRARTLTGFHFSVTMLIGMVSKSTGFCIKAGRNVSIWSSVVAAITCGDDKVVKSGARRGFGWSGFRKLVVVDWEATD